MCGGALVAHSELPAADATLLE
eukprot:SAG11_NODE_34181_length_273_cov_0.885057_1_plen_21_part_10